MQGAEQASRSRTVALVLAGAAAKGAFEAGALDLLSRRRIRVCRIVAASSGALNATAYAAGVRARREEDVARELCELWRTRGGFWDVVHPSLAAILGRRGFSDQSKLLALLRKHVRPVRIAAPAPIDLHLVVAPLDGSASRAGPEPATTFTRILSFGGECFDDAGRLEEVFRAATASAAMPLLYAPVDLPGLGPCVDGGLVNNAPIRFATSDGLDAVLVIAPTPAAGPPRRRPLRGLDLLAQVIDMLFGERIYQDLRERFLDEEAFARVHALGHRLGWTPEVLGEIDAAFSRRAGHPVRVASVRPLEPLPGNPFSAFLSEELRLTYLQIGKARAASVLDAMGW